MKIQDLAIIFIIIILPISLVISTYTQYQIQTVNTQTLYDSKLTAATYDAIRAFQINTSESATSEIVNSKMRDLEASVSTFRNSIKSTFALSGYSEDAMDTYIPALVYTLYDGFYIYSPYQNVNYRFEPQRDANNNIVTDSKGNTIYTDIRADGNGESQYGLKPYISYSCRYKKENENIDVVITYSLDNHVSVKGTIGNQYVNKDGYLIDNITVNGDEVTYNGILIDTEQVKEYLPIGINNNDIYKCIKLNGTTYYLDEEGHQIIARLNDSLTIQCSEEKNGKDVYNKWAEIIKNNTLAKDYYKDAYEFTEWFKSSGLDGLTYGDAIDSVIDNDGNVVENQPLWNGENQRNQRIFEFNNSQNYSDNIENESSKFNEHRLAIIRHKIEVNLAIAIANYNNYLGTNNVFQMPELNEIEWYNITHNISLMSFLQGLPIGGKSYNGYALVTNSESKEVVLENNIYILGEDSDGTPQYYKIGDRNINIGTITSGSYGDGTAKSAGRINLDFERSSLVNKDRTKTYYYYPLAQNDASYNSVIMQNNVDTYDDVYTYVNAQSNKDLKSAFYMALGRERAGTYKQWSNYVDTSIKVNGNADNKNDNVDPVVYHTITYVINGKEISTDRVLDGNSYNVRTVNLSGSTFEEGTIFNGWTDGVKTYMPGNTISNVSNNITLTAVFTKN